MEGSSGGIVSTGGLLNSSVDDDLFSLERQDQFDLLSRSPVTTFFLTIGFNSVIPIINCMLPPQARIPEPAAQTLQAAVEYVAGELGRKSSLFFGTLSAELNNKQQRI